ncbi:Kelch-type beta propeller [Phytophthora cactorum]|nr:Kelch-type beta propeller [Phytophthora cactorum]
MSLDDPANSVFTCAATAMALQPSSRAWVPVPCENPSAAPCHRSLHVCAVRKDSLYIFGGYDGSSRINDFYEFNFKRKLWSVVLAIGSAPSPRDRHVAVVYKDSFYVFAGFDGSSRVNDFIEYNFLTQRWSNVVVNAGLPPTARHSHAAVVYDKSMYCFGGYDGSYRNDFHEFNFGTWQLPDAFLDLGTAVNDFYELDLFNGQPPGQRFCHVGTVYDSSLIIFGGYDGSSRLNDFKQFRFGEEEFQLEIPESTLINDLRMLVNNDIMSDVTFIVEGIPVYGHKILCIRCNYFNAMLTGEMLESRAREIQITDVRRPIFISLMEYLYTDYLDVAVDVAMELFVTADRHFPRCRLHNATVLRDQCVTFMLHNFDAVTKTDSFEEMGRTNVELVFELLSAVRTSQSRK